MKTRLHLPLVLALLASVTVSCQTKYQEISWDGGVTAQQITTDTYRIVARGNGYTSATTIKDYALLKAAEVTKDAVGVHIS